MEYANHHADLTVVTNTLGSTLGSMNTNVPLPHSASFESKGLNTIIDKTTTMQLQKYVSSLSLIQISRIPSGGQMTNIELEITVTQRDLQHPSNIAEQQIGYSNHYAFGPHTMAYIQSRWKMTQDKKK